MPFHPLGFFVRFFKYTFETRIFYALKSLNPLITLLWEREHNCFCSHMDCLILLLMYQQRNFLQSENEVPIPKFFLASLQCIAVMLSILAIFFRFTRKSELSLCF